MTRALEAMFQAVWDEDWLAGVYTWKWFPGLLGPSPGRLPAFSPQSRPAEAVVECWFAGTAAGAGR